MKKCLILLSVILSLFVSSAVFGVVKDESVATDEGYSVYRLGDLGLVLPDYLIKISESTDGPEEASFIWTENGNYVALAIGCMRPDDYGNSGYYYSKIMYDTLIDSALEAMTNEIGQVKEKGTAEKLTFHGHECRLSTSSFEKDYLMKVAVVFDDTTENIYMINYLYTKSLDNTKYVSDFYKMVYTNPYEYATVQSNSNIQSGDYEATAGDYLDALGSYLDAWGSLSEGDYSGSLEHLGDALDKTSAIENGERYTPDQNYGSSQQYNGGATDNDVLIAYIDFLRELNEQNNK